MKISTSYYMVALKIKLVRINKIKIMSISMFQLLVVDIKVMQVLCKMIQKALVLFLQSTKIKITIK